MKKRVISMVVSVLAVILVSTAAFAEEKVEEKKPGINVEEIKNALGMSIYLQGGYTYNFEGSTTNAGRIFDEKANTILFDLAQLQFLKEPPTGGVGFKLKLSAGETAKYIHSLGLGIREGENPNDTSVFDLTEAYVSYVAPLGKGLRFDFGKMVTYFGAEVIEARDNPNYSRSFLFNYAIPFTHTGLKVSYPFSEAISASLHVCNGWDDTDDNNNGKSVGLSLGVTPMEQLSMSFNTMYGPEKTDNNHDERFLFDWVGTIKPVKDLAFILNFDYGTEQHSAPDGGTATWWGIAGIGKYDVNDWFSLALRYEYFDDKDGLRTGAAQKLQEVTFTPEFKITKAVLLRPEYRHDWSDQKVFPNGDNALTKKSQDTIALAIMYTW